MLLEASALEAAGGAQVADVCVVGAGAAGITLALALARKRRRVLLLEGGQWRPDSSSQELYGGNALFPDGTPNGEYLSVSRDRVVGGTTGRWNGLCHPLEASDFEGWPFGAEELWPYYRRAAGWVEIGSSLPGPGEDAAPGLPGFTVRTYQRSAPTRFGQKYKEELTRSAHCRLAVGASVVELELEAAGGAVASAKVSLPGGKLATVRAKTFVLAAGGVENARLLLASRARAPGGIGNRRGMVGRYFMEHFLGVGGVALAGTPGHPFPFPSLPPGLSRPLQFYALPAATRKEHGLLNARFHFERSVDGRFAGAEEPRHTAGVAELLRAAGDPVAVAWRIVMLVEQAPDPSSRIYLSGERDRLGVPKAELAWKVSGAEERTARDLLRRVGLLMGAASRGRVWDAGGSWILSGSWDAHHLGTTRMASHEAAGVVDPDGRVFGTRNLYLAGSSVFPTGGAVNPTFTIVALALRLAEHLGRAAA